MRDQPPPSSIPLQPSGTRPEAERHAAAAGAGDIDRAYLEYSRAHLAYDDITLDAIDLLEEGVSVSQAARDLGITEAALRSRARASSVLGGLVAISDAHAARQQEEADITAFLEAVTQGVSARAAAARLGHSYYWVQKRIQSDPTFARLLSDARQIARDARVTRPMVSAADIEAERRMKRQQCLALIAGSDREALTTLYRLLEDGRTLTEALTSMRKSFDWLEGARRRVPEAANRIKRSLEAGKVKRPRARQTSVRITSRDTRARKIVLAAIASGASFEEAGKKVGTTGSWVAIQYHRNADFGAAVRAVLLLNQDYDLSAELARHDKRHVAPAPRLSRDPVGLSSPRTDTGDQL
ncbi:hypothetical protein ACFXKW_35755 [Streptomyces sp. NPDC059193]|uniref:hypothetical protein n=1 Tax=Streptomyces sp. NPDC059193 TaxID=3346763 RepID=UPI00368D1B3D